MLVTITCNVTREEDGTNHPAGMVIGESALVGDAPHESTFVVSSPGVILAVHRMHYRQIAIQGAKLRHFDDPRHATIIADLPLLAPLNEKQLERIAKAVVMRTYMPGESIVQPEDVALGLFVVKSGQVTCWVASAADTHETSTRRSSLSITPSKFVTASAKPPPFSPVNEAEASDSSPSNVSLKPMFVTGTESIGRSRTIRSSSMSSTSSFGAEVSVQSLSSLDYDENSVRLRVLGPGDQFGESSLLYNKPSGITVVASGEGMTECAVIPGEIFWDVVGENEERGGGEPKMRRRCSLNAVLELVSDAYHRRLMSRNPLLGHLSNGQLDVLLQGMQIESFGRNAEILPRKDASDEGAVYIITQGYVKIFVGKEEHELEQKEEEEDVDDKIAANRSSCRTSALPRYVSENLDSRSFVGSFIGSIASSRGTICGNGDDNDSNGASALVSGSAVMLKGECFGEETLLSDSLPLMHVRYRALCGVSCMKLPKRLLRQAHALETLTSVAERGGSQEILEIDGSLSDISEAGGDSGKDGASLHAPLSPETRRKMWKRNASKKLRSKRLAQSRKRGQVVLQSSRDLKIDRLIWGGSKVVKKKGCCKGQRACAPTRSFEQ